MKLEKITRLANRAGLKIKKHAPDILLVVGVAGTVVSTVMACKDTLKVTDILDESKEQLDQIKKVASDKKLCEKHNYTEEDKTKDLTIVYTKTAVNILKLYAPSLILGAVSIGCIVSGQKILKKRNIAIGAAYITLKEGFDKYRDNVKEKYGEEVDKELRFGIKDKIVKEKVTDKNGKEKTTETVVSEYNPQNWAADISEYSRFFDECSDQHQKDPEYNMKFLKCQQQYANEKLKAQGHLFLNEVYDMLGIPRSKAGAVVGWIYDRNNPEKYSDGYVDFGLYNGTEANRRFVNGQEYNILLDFNVDGVIYDKI